MAFGICMQSGGATNFMDRAIINCAHALEEAWAWGFDVDVWRAHLNAQTWPEVCTARWPSLIVLVGISVACQLLRLYFHKIRVQSSDPQQLAASKEHLRLVQEWLCCVSTSILACCHIFSNHCPASLTQHILAFCRLLRALFSL